MAVGALALGGLAVLPVTGAFAAANELTGTVQTAGGVDINGATVTAYRVDASEAPASDTTDVNGEFVITGLTDGGEYKVRIDATGQVSEWVTATGAGPYAATAGSATYVGATTLTYDDAAGTDITGNIQLATAGAAVSTTTITSITPLGNDGNPAAGQTNPFPGQRVRVAVSVAAGGQTPGGFVQLTGGDLAPTNSLNGSQMATLSGGTATIDMIVAGAATAAGDLDVRYSGDANVAPGTGTIANRVIQGGGGTITNTVTTAGAPVTVDGVTVEIWNVAATPTPGAVVTTDSNGTFRASLPNGNYRLRFVKSGAVSEWGAGTLSYTAATNVAIADNVVNANANATTQLNAVGAAALATPTVAVSPAAPKVGETVTFTVTAANGTTGAVNFQGSGVEFERALDGNNPSVATLSRTFSAAGTQNVVFTYGGSATNAARTFTVPVTVGGGSILSGRVTSGGANLNGATVRVYNAANTQVGTTTTAADGTYSLGLENGTYKVGFSNGATHVVEFNNDKPTLLTGDAVVIDNAPVTVDAVLTADGAGDATQAVTVSPASPTVGEPFTVTVTVSGGGAGTPAGSLLPVDAGDANFFSEADRRPLVNGTATFSIVRNTTTAFDLQFAYSGDATRQAETENPADITIGNKTFASLTASQSTVKSGTNITLRAVVSPASGAIGDVDPGTVTFKNGTTVINTTAVDVENGLAEFLTTTPLPVGANQITVEYSGGTGFAGSTSQPILVTVLPAAGTLEPVDPTRVLQPTSVGQAATTTITFAGATAPPAGATAVKLNVTVSGVSQTTYVSACAGGTAVTTCDDSSVINSSGDDLRNFVIVPLGGSGTNQVTLYNHRGTVNLSADLMGWVVDTTSTTNGVFAAYNPTRITENPVLLGQGGATTVTLDNVPAGATAVAVNVTVAGVTGNTFVSGCAWGTPSDDCNESSIINSNRQDRANMAIIPLGGTLNNKLRFYNNAGQTQLILDLQGYVLGSAGTGSDGRYQAVTPTRLIQPTSIAQEEFKTFQLTGVPAGATAVALNLTAAGVKANTYFSACPSTLANSSCSSTSVLNSRGPDTAGFVIVKLGGANNDEIKLYNNRGSNLIIADLQGWVIG